MTSAVLIASGSRDTALRVRALVGRHGERVLEAGTARSARFVTALESLSLVVVAPPFPDASAADLLLFLDRVCPRVPHLLVDPADSDAVLATALLAVFNGTPPEGRQEQRAQILEHEPAARSSLADKLAALAASYVAALPARIEALRLAVTGARTDSDQRQAAQQMAHKLHGTAGSYALGSLSEDAARLEHALDRAPGDPGDVAWAEVMDALGVVVGEAARVLHAEAEDDRAV